MDSTPSVPAKVLIVDDLEEARWALSNLIRLAGFAPVAVASGEEALARVRHEAPDVVLLDVRLPDMDGFEVLTRVKAHDKTVPVIMVTAYGKTHDAVRAIRGGPTTMWPSPSPMRISSSPCAAPSRNRR